MFNNILPRPNGPKEVEALRLVRLALYGLSFARANALLECAQSSLQYRFNEMGNEILFTPESAAIKTSWLDK